jgi:outer membrane protein assembly factor BamD (BamD/ComL family)
LQKPGELFSKVIHEHGLSKAAKLALPQVAYAKFVEKKYDEAIGLYTEFLNKVAGNTDYESLTHLALAACYEAKGDFKSAETSLSGITKNPKDPFREVALMSLARVDRLQNLQDKEKEILETLLRAYPDSPYVPMVKARLVGARAQKPH